MRTIISILVCGMLLSAQGATMTLEPFAPGRRPVFVNVLTCDTTPYAYVIRNDSDQAIKAITIRWTWTDAKGHAITHDFQSGSFYLITGSVVGAHDQLLIAPGFLLSGKLQEERATSRPLTILGTWRS